MFCSKCGNQLSDGARFCGQCGSHVKSIVQQKEEASVFSTDLEEDAYPIRQKSASPVEGTASFFKKNFIGRLSNKQVIAIAGAAFLILAVFAVLIVKGCTAAPEEMRIEESADEVTEVDKEAGQENTNQSDMDWSVDARNESAFPESWITVSKSDTYELMNLDGKTVDVQGLESEEVEYAQIGSFSSGYAVAKWTTSEYDEEWKTAHDQRTHIGLFDSSGKLAIELTQIIRNAGITSDTFNVNIDANVRYLEGRLVLLVEPGNLSSKDRRFFKAIVFDEKGEYVYDFDIFPPSFVALSDASLAYHDGVLASCYPVYDSSGSSSYKLFDLDGNVLAASSQRLDSLGYGYYYSGSYVTQVYSYDGSVVFDAESLEGGDLTYGHLTGWQLGGGGLASVEITKKNPYGGSDKSLYGLYDLKTNSWLIPLDELVIHCGEYYEGVFPVATSELGSSNESFSKLITSSGDTVFDASMADASFGMTEEFGATYLCDGLWFIEPSSSTARNVVIHIKDGKHLAERSVSAIVASEITKSYNVKK